MKISNIITLRNIYIFAAIHCSFLIIVCGRQWYPDTQSYIEAWDTISKLQIDMWRTPIYPLFLGILKFIFGSEQYLIWGTVIQHIIFLISIYYFHKLLVNVLKSQKVAIYITAFYAIYPCVSSWNCYMITDSFAIYGMIFLLYCTSQFVRSRNNLYIICYAFWTIFLIFLRPSQIYILPIFLIGWVLFYFKMRHMTKVYLRGITAICLSTIILLFYCQCYKNSYGIFSPCGIGVVNKYYIARMDGVLKPEYTDNIELKKYLHESIKKHGLKYGNGTDHDLLVETYEAIYNMGLKDVSEFVSTADKQDFKTFIRRFIQRFHKAANDKLFTSYIHTWRNFTDIFGINMRFIYWLLIVYPFILAYWIYKKANLPWFSITLYMLGFSHLFVILFACQNNWDRLILPAIPIYLILIGQLFSMITIRKSPNVEFE